MADFNELTGMPVGAKMPQANPFPVIGAPRQKFLGSLIKPIVSTVTDFIPGPIDDIIVDTVTDRLTRRRTPTGPTIAPARTPTSTLAVPQNGCQPPFVRDQSGICVFPNSPADRSTDIATNTVSAAVPGRMGMAGVAPQVITSQRLRCPRGMVLGADNVCYDKRVIRKSDRKWVPGRKPLLTGGELNAIAKAARAAKKLETQKKRLEKLGLMKKPSRGRGRRSGVAQNVKVVVDD